MKLHKTCPNCTLPSAVCLFFSGNVEQGDDTGFGHSYQHWLLLTLVTQTWTDNGKWEFLFKVLLSPPLVHKAISNYNELSDLKNSTVQPTYRGQM